jgi:hypothetical protein
MSKEESKTLSCLKCCSSMEPGYIIEKDYATRDKPSEWISSGAESDTKTGSFGGKTKGQTPGAVNLVCLAL